MQQGRARAPTADKQTSVVVGAHHRVPGDWTVSSASRDTADRRHTQTSTRTRLNLRVYGAQSPPDAPQHECNARE
jgi:hypothetical protein